MKTPFAVRFCLTVCLIAGLVSSLALSAERNAKLAAESQARIKESVGYLSSDELGGRGPGTEGLNKAADFLADEFKKLGLKTDLFDGTPFQKFELTITTEMGPKDQNKLVLEGPEKNGERKTLSLALGSDF